MTLKLADPGAEGLFPSVEIPIVGGRHHGRFVSVPDHSAALKKENYLEGEYYSPRWQGVRCVALHPRRWFKMGVEAAISMCEVYGPLHQRWPRIEAIGGVAHGSKVALGELNAKGSIYFLRRNEASTIWEADIQPYRFYRAESGIFYFIPHDWPEAEIPARAAKAKILGRKAS